MHEVLEKDREEFKRKMIWLKKNFPNVILTFDDGLKCFYTVIFPVLKELNIPAIFFIPSGALNLRGDEAQKFIKENLKRNNLIDDFLTSEELLEITNYKNDAGKNIFTIGGHTKNHVDCGTTPGPSLAGGEEVLLREIKEDKENLEKIIGQKIEHFAFPFGSDINMSNEAIETIKSSGYKYSFSIMPGFWNKNNLNYDNFRINRDSLTLQESDAVWLAWLNGGYDVFTKIKNII